VEAAVGWKFEARKKKLSRRHELLGAGGRGRAACAEFGGPPFLAGPRAPLKRPVAQTYQSRDGALQAIPHPQETRHSRGRDQGIAQTFHQL